MILEIDSTSDVAIYKQIRDQIVVGIAQGKLAPNELLPSVRQLADEIGINMMTVSKAYTLLKDEGYIVTDRRKGTLVKTELVTNEGFKKNCYNQLQLLLAEAVLHDLSEMDILRIVQEQLATFRKEEE